VPAFALVLLALLLNRREPFKNSLTFATHFFAFALIWLCALFPTLAIGFAFCHAEQGTSQWLHSVDLVATA